MNHGDEFESLSALVDDELPDDELRFLLRRTGNNAALKASWERYLLIGDAMRGKALPPMVDQSFADGVIDRIRTDAEPQYNIPPRASHGRWLRWSAGGVIAAGVALAALTGTGLQPQSTDMSALTADSQTPENAPAVQAVASATPEAPQTGVAESEANVASAPVAPRWLQASPSVASMASPAAAEFPMLSPWLHRRDASQRYVPVYRQSPPQQALPLRDVHYATARSPYMLWSPPEQVATGQMPGPIWIQAH